MATKTRKNGNRDGSVTFHKGKKLWFVRMTVGSKRKGFYCRTKDAADQKLKELQYLHGQGIAIDTDSITLNQVISQWAKRKEMLIDFGELKRVTVVNYLTLINLYISNDKIKPTLGTKQIKNITKDTIEELFHTMVQDGKSNSVINHVRAVLIDIMNFAVDDDREYILKNPALKTTKFSTDKRDAPLRTGQQITDLLAKIKIDYPNLYELYFTYLWSGERRNELLALRWKDLIRTSDGLSINITRSFYRGKGGTEYFGKPKTKGSTRIVPLSTANALLFNNMKERHKEYGVSTEPEDRIFKHLDGTNILPDYATRVFSKIVKSLGWDNFHLHDLRGTHGSLLMATGRTLKEIQNRLGQTSDVTMDHYIRTNEELDRSLADNLDEKLKDFGITVPE